MFNPITKDFTTAQKANLQTLMTNQESQPLEQRSYVEAYKAVLRFISQAKDPVTNVISEPTPTTPIEHLERIPNMNGSFDNDYTKTWLFIKQAAEINNSEGQIASDAIRDFTFKTYKTYFDQEYGGQGSASAGDTWMQKISNAIALEVLTEMVGEKKLSLLSQIVEQDAVTAAVDYYNPNNNGGEFGVWAGNAFFVAAGESSAFNSHLLHDGKHSENQNDTDLDDTYDLLATSKAILELGGELNFIDSFELFVSNVWHANAFDDIAIAAIKADTFLENAYDENSNIAVTDLSKNKITLGTVYDDLIYDPIHNDSSPYAMPAIVHGGAGNDTIIISVGSDYSFGTSNDIIDGGKGIDTIAYTGTYNATIDLENHKAEIHLPWLNTIESVYRIENVTTSYGDDTITGNEEDNVLKGATGVDTYHLNGDFGYDVIEDDGGVLVIDGQTPMPDNGSAYVRVGSGQVYRTFETDWILEDNPVDPQGEKLQTLKLTEVDSAGNITGNSVLIKDYYNNIDNWNFSLENYRSISGTNGYDFLIGSSMNDIIFGRDGYLDFLVGAEGNDRLVGGGGEDILDGGVGSDVYAFSRLSDSYRTSSQSATDKTHDKIATFVHTEDLIDVTNMGVTGVAADGLGGIRDIEYKFETTSSGVQTTVVTSNYNDFRFDMSGHVTLVDNDFLGLATASLNLNGDHSANEFVDSAFSDTFNTFGDNDVIYLSSGSDVVNAGDGVEDRVVYAAVSTDYTFSGVTEQIMTVNHWSGDSDLLGGVEIIEFSDKAFYWDGDDWTINSPDSLPVAAADSVATAYEQAVTIDVLFNDSDVEDESFNASNLSIEEDPSDGIVVIQNTGNISYIPNIGFSGSDSFVYKLTDSAGGINTATVSIEVGAAAVNVAPVAANDVVVTDYEEAVVVSVLGNDTDEDVLGDGNITIESDPSNGAVVINTDGTITYTPDATYSGADSFDYTVTDSQGLSDTATVSVTVNAIPSNYAPDAVDDTAIVVRDGTVDITVLTNDTDTEDTSFSNSNLSIDANPANGGVSINSNGTIAYTPDAGYVGADSFTYTLTDSGSEIDTATVDITVQAGIDPNASATHIGDANNNNISASTADDTLSGLAGDDTLYGNSGNDQIVGGLGDDTLKGYKGNDTYIWASGDGNDHIEESNTSVSGTDILYFTGGITLADLNMYGSTSHDFKIEYVPTGEVINIKNQYHYDADYAVESLSFDDGSSFDLLQGTTWLGGVGNQRLDGSVYDDSMRGGQGNDTVLGDTGNDTLYGDVGNDSVYGDEGDDTYVWRSGDGDDLLIESNSGGTDTLLLTGGITQNDISVYGFTSHDMRVEYIATGEIITLQNLHYSDADYRIETLTFDDGSSYNLDQAALWLGGVGNQSLIGSIYNDTMRGGKDDDTVNGDDGNDILHGDLGDDTVYGGAGDDTYVWEAGRGDDLLIENNSGGTDTLYLKGGITYNDLHVYGYTSHDLRVEYMATGEIVTLQNMHYSDVDYHIEFLSFDDGTTYDLSQGVQWLGGVGSQHLQGSIYDDTMFGGKDNDTLSGDAGDDTLSGDLGNDSLKGAFGDDTYLWKAGDGNDIFAEQSNSGSTGDTVHLQFGITLADLDIYGTTSHDVKIVYTPTGETITLQNQLHSDADYHFETLMFDDGSTYNLEQGVEVRGGSSGDNLDGGAYDDTMLGGAGNDTLEGFAGDDVFKGGAGVDRLYGRQGDDVYVWESGDGNDLIYEQNYSGSGSDTLHLTGGIVAADVTFSQTGNDLLVTYTPTGEAIRIDNQYVSDTDYHVETLLFDNGSTVDLLGV